MKKYRVASLFSGCGGLDLGFSGGFEFMGRCFGPLPTEIVFANDVDSDAATCYNTNSLLTSRGHSECLLKDIRLVDVDAIPDFDILLAGFPCQPFSNAGKRKGVHDDDGRGTLFEECERILKSKIQKGRKPIAFVFENVRGILSSKMPSGISVPNEIKNRMESIGYNVSTQLVCARDYGVPQSRYRVIIVGTDVNLPSFNFDQMMAVVAEFNIPSYAQGNYGQLLVGSILQNLQGISGADYWEYTAATQNMVDMIGPCRAGAEALPFFKQPFQISDIPEAFKEGRSWKNIDPEKLPPRFKRIYDDPKRYHSPNFYRRFALGEINGTITASAQPENCGITHPIENRRYTVREIARIQSFPDEFSFDAIPLQSRYKVIGNAVPPVLAWVIAYTLIKTIS